MKFKKHSANGKEVLACCDDGLLGKKISGKGFGFEVKASFYGEEDASKEELAQMIRNAENANLLGNECVGIALKEGLISERSVIEINGVRHAIIMKI